MENNKSSIIGVLLISVMIMALMYNTANEKQLKEDQQQTETELVDSTDQTTVPSDVAIVNPVEPVVQDTEPITINADSIKDFEAKAKLGSFGDFAVGEEEVITLENDLLRLELSSKGAQVKQVELKEFLTFAKTPLLLIDESSEFGLAFQNKTNQLVNTKGLYYTTNQENGKVTFTAEFGDGAKIEHIYSVEEGSYLVDYDVNFYEMGELLNTSTTFLSTNWDYVALSQERDLTREKQKSSIYWREKAGDVGHIGVGKSKSENADADAVEWIGFKQQFFSSVLLTKGKFKKGAGFTSLVDMEDSTRVADFHADLVLPFENGSNNMYELQYYFGPNDYKLLNKTIGRETKELVELSADFIIFRWVKVINKWVIIPLFNLLEKVTSNYGIIILLLTLIIKMVLMPLTFKSHVSTAKQKLLKPELDALKEKYPDQQKYAAKQMELYSKTGVSMFGGCLPTLLQMPILLAMFYFFPSSIELRQESFLWAQDLSTFDTVPFLTWNFEIPFLGMHLSPFTLLMTLSSLLMAKYNTQMQASPSQPGMEMMKYMPYIFPFFLLFLFNSWPAALTYYYFLSNMISFGQQFAIKKFFIDEDKIRLQLEENKKKPVKKKSGFAAKLEEVYKQQQQTQQSQKKNKK